MARNTVSIHIRIPVYLHKLYIELSERQDESVSELIRKASLELFNKENSSMQNELKLMLVKENKKKINSRYYIIKNMYKRILDMAMSSYFTTGSINMKVINNCIDEFVAEFECYDDKIKKALGIDFKLTVKRLRNQNFLLQQSDTMNKLKLIGKK